MNYKKCFLIIPYLLLIACTNQRINWDPDDYTVGPGDTLYSIAWRYEIDSDDLARWNHLSPPYTIYPGERLHTRKSDSLKADQLRAEQKNTGKNRPEEITVRRGDTLYSLSREYGVSVARLAALNGLIEPYVIAPGQTLSLVNKVTKTPTVARVRPAAKIPIRPETVEPVKSSVFSGVVSDFDKNRKVKWQWPVQGKLLASFNKNKSNAKGIDIAGTEGKSVRAASSGKVVYSGNGLVSYGNLIIIKHSKSYLSAYAHNKKLLVKEGDTVKAGQKISELGKTGREKPKLHFEIRKNGKPVNPLRYLPRS